MIIKYPTGLYSNVLPTISGIGNVTYLISNSAPPRSNSTILKIPKAIDGQKRDIPIISYDFKRKAIGTLVATVSKSSRLETGTNALQYETGTILSFEDIAVTEINDISTTESMEIRHDSFYSDLSLYGVDTDKVSSSANNAYKQLSDMLNSYKQQLFDSKKLISTYQSTINELNRSIASLIVLLEFDNTIQGSIDILNSSLSDYNNKLQEQIVLADQYSLLIATTTDKIRSLAMVVR
jgi:hypothetical protein